MSALSPSELDAATLLRRISSAELPREVIVLIARGFLPIPQEELVTVLVHLGVSDDTEIAELARASLRELPPKVVLSLAADVTATAETLSALSKDTTDVAVLEAIIRNRAASDETLEELAGRVGAALQEVIVINQERILRRPAILDALLANSSISGDVRRRALEVREEFFEKKKVEAPVEEPELALDDELADLTPEQQAELQALMSDASDMEGAPPPTDEEIDELLPGERKADNAWRRIMKMTISQKVQVAYKGGATERGILIRERNKLVCAAVIKSPRITDSEVEAFAGMRNIEDEVLRLIGMNRQWMSKYSIMSALIRNPKAPIGIVLPLINRLTLKDLKTLSGDKGVSEAIRQSARKLYQVRRQQ